MSHFDFTSFYESMSESEAVDLHGHQCVAQAAWLESVEQAEEDIHVGAPGENAEDETSAGSEYLRWEQQEAIQEGTKVHAEDALALGLVLLEMARRTGKEQSEPSFERPC